MSPSRVERVAKALRVRTALHDPHDMVGIFTALQLSTVMQRLSGVFFLAMYSGGLTTFSVSKELVEECVRLVNLGVGDQESSSSLKEVIYSEDLYEGFCTYLMVLECLTISDWSKRQFTFIDPDVIAEFKLGGLMNANVSKAIN